MRHVLPLAVAFGAVCTLVGSASAQRLIGFTGRAAPPSSNITFQALCNPPTTVCPVSLPAPALDWAGGAAYSPMRDSLFHTEGTRILEVDLQSCAFGCAMPATRSLGATSFASGLTINPARNEMYELETVTGFAAVTTWRFVAGQACPARRSTCRIQLPTRRHRAGAIAFDQKRDLIYVAAAVFGVADPDNVLLIYRRGDTGCQPFCRIPVDDCFTGRIQSIRALAYDECRDEIYISDGRQTSTQRVIWLPTSGCPVLRPVACCPLAHPAGEFWAGFDIRSVLPRNLGFSCTSRPCASCPGMRLDAVGAAVPGNTEFGFQISDAPAGSTGFVFVGLGSCSAGLPFLCGRLWLPLLVPPLGIGPVPLPGGGPCGGDGFFPLPLPNDPALCSGLLCVQGAVVCSAGGLVGLGLTNAVVVPFGP